MHWHCRSCLQYGNTKSWITFQVKLQGLKIKRFRPYHGCSVSNIKNLACVSSPCLWLSMVSQRIDELKKIVECFVFRIKVCLNGSNIATLSNQQCWMVVVDTWIWSGRIICNFIVVLLSRLSRELASVTNFHRHIHLRCSPFECFYANLQRNDNDSVG